MENINNKFYSKLKILIVESNQIVYPCMRKNQSLNLILLIPRHAKNYKNTLETEVVRLRNQIKLLKK
jgi:hypothetical protein